ncbi:hypothetical protein ACHAWX_000233 [Stephanocyclus meneghinianus]
MRTSKAALSISTAFLLHASSAQLMRATGLRRDQPMRSLEEDAEFGRELSMSAPDEGISFETSLSLPVSLSVPTVIRPSGAKASKDSSVGRPLVTNGPGFIHSSEFALGTPHTETNSEFEIVLSASESTSTSFEFTSEQSVFSVSSDVAVDGSTSSSGSVADVNTVTESSTDSKSLEPLAPETISLAPAQTLTPAPTDVAVGVDSKAAKESFVEVDILSTDSESFGVSTPPTDPGFSGKSGKMT